MIQLLAESEFIFLSIWKVRAPLLLCRHVGEYAAYSPTWLHTDIVEPSSSFFLLGMRGTGKSSWIQRAFPKALLINLLDEALYQDLLL
jgi:hypothetical protein